MSQKTWTMLILIFLIMLGLNYLTPLCYGDDYVYAFIWPGQSMYVPLPETAERVSGFAELIESQWSHYLTGNGRFPAHILVQFFLWQGKWLFNILNSLVFVLLVLEIYWIADKGNVSFKYLQPELLCIAFFSLWAFTVNFGGVFLWISGSCNYLWMLVLLLSFSIVYIRKYFQMDAMIINSVIAKYILFFWGVLAGWTNENTVCWVILLLGFWLIKNRKHKGMEIWMWYGFIGLCLGFILLIFAPGNMVRSSSYAGVNIWSLQSIRHKLITFGIIEFFEVFLWFFIITSLRKLKQCTVNVYITRQLVLIKVFCVLNLLCNGIMLLAPEFPARSGFASLVFLIIVAVSLIRLQSKTNIKLIDDFAKKFLTTIAGSYFLITLGATYVGMFSTNQYDKNVVQLVKQHKSADYSSVLEIPPPPVHSELLITASGRHLIRPELTEDENDWSNVAYARYYGIRGIRIKK